MTSSGRFPSVLHTLTGEEKYRAMALRVGDARIEAQSGDGSRAPGEKHQNDCTAERVISLDEIDQAVGDG